MPLIVEGLKVPERWLERKPSSRVVAIDRPREGSDCVRIALINNMPDAALEDTELQFFDLLDAASEDRQVMVKLFSLTGVPRTDRGMRHLNSFYAGIDELWNSQFDALIMTGTEPQQSNLRQEPYWPTLTKALDWAETNTVSTVLSCLAAHAGVLHNDGIERQRLSDKRFGVFDFTKPTEHSLTSKTGDVVRFPHSRWNEVRTQDLKACGYSILTQSAHAGVDCFVKRKKNSLFVHFQGHPEYGEHTLLKEYRRDIKRFLRGERETYPTMPAGYFDSQTASLLDQFCQRALNDRTGSAADDFPEKSVMKSLQRTWQPCAVGVYRNWLKYVLQQKAQHAPFLVVQPVAQGTIATGTDRAR